MVATGLQQREEEAQQVVVILEIQDRAA